MLYQNILLVVLLSSPVWFFLFVYFYLAPNNKFFTFVKEGKAKLIMKGGECVKTLIQFKGYTIDHVTGKVVRGEEKHLFGGLRFYGLWPLYDVTIYDFKWTNVDHKGQIIIHEPETLDYVLLRDDVYWANVEDAEDKNLLPLDIEVTLTIRVVNPYKAIFNVQNWLETVINRIKPAIRDSVTGKEFEELIKNEKDIGKEIFRKLSESSEGVPLLQEFEESYGARIKAIEIKDINPPEEHRKATLKKFLAKREREAVVVNADAERKRIRAVYKTIQGFGDLGKLIRALEAAEKSPLASSLQVQAIPGLQNLVSSVYGTSEVGKEEIKKLREEIEELKRKESK
jgi:hypothetical protein